MLPASTRLVMDDTQAYVSTSRRWQWPLTPTNIVAPSLKLPLGLPKKVEKIIKIRREGEAATEILESGNVCLFLPPPVQCHHGRLELV